MNHKDIARRLGMPTAVLKDMSLDQAVAAIHGNGFGVFEINPSAYGGPDVFDQTARKDLKEKLRCFDTVSVHASAAMYLNGEKINYWSPDGIRDDIASLDDALRGQSVDDYLTYIDLAADIGAGIATFHPGLGDKNATPDQKRLAFLDFANQAVARAQGSDIRLGYEISPTFFDLDLIDRVDGSNFGILFDIGHAALRCTGDATAGILELLAQSASHIVQFHVHGLHITNDGEKKDHHPLHMNNGIDYTQIMRAIKTHNIAAPLVFEIAKYPGRSTPENLKNAIHAKNELLKIWQTL